MSNLETNLNGEFERDGAAVSLAGVHADGSARQQIADLIDRLRQVAGELPADQTSEEDLKLLSQALRELRRAFGVFAPYRTQRKVTVFGSARTPRDAPAYEQAEKLGRAMAEQGWFVVTGAATGIMGAPDFAARVAGPMGKVVASPQNSTGTSPGR